MSIVLQAITSEAIFSVVLTVVLLCLLLLLWKRGRTYYLAWKLPGMLGYPIVGVIPYFMNNEEIIPNTLKFLQKYGNFVRIWLGPIPAVAICKPEHLQIVLNSPHCLGKDKLAYCQDPEFAGKGLIIVEPKIWKLHRKMISPAFNQKILDTYIDIFLEQINILEKQLHVLVGTGQFDIYNVIDKCTLDIVCETTMGTKIGAQTKPSEFFEVMPRICTILMERVVQIWLYPPFIWHRSALGKEFKQLCDVFHHYTKPVITTKQTEYFERKEKLKNGEIVEDDDKPKRKTLLDILFDAEDEKIFNHEEIYQEVSTFISTGTDTVALTVSYCLLALAMNPHIQNKVVEELEDVFGHSDRPVSLEDLPKLIYLEQTFKESMRYFTPVPIVAREVGEDIQLDDFIVPKYMMVIIPFVRLHQDPEIWPNPDRFDPNRFTAEESAKRHPYSYLPFSGGPRNCIGMRYGYMLSKILIATILRKYAVNTTTRRENMKFSHQIVMKPVDGINISLENRF